MLLCFCTGNSLIYLIIKCLINLPQYKNSILCYSVLFCAIFVLYNTLTISVLILCAQKHSFFTNYILSTLFKRRILYNLYYYIAHFQRFMVLLFFASTKKTLVFRKFLQYISPYKPIKKGSARIFEGSKRRYSGPEDPL